MDETEQTTEQPNTMISEGVTPVTNTGQAQSTSEAQLMTENIVDTPTQGKESTETKALEYNFDMPEGFELDKALSDELKPVLSKFKVGNEEAQSLVNMHIKAIQNMQKQTQEAWFKQEKDWLETVNKDPELGDQKNQTMALQAMKQFASPELRTLLEDTRLGSHPEMVRLFIQLGKSISEDSAVVGTAGNTQTMPRDETGRPMLSFKTM